MFERKIQKSYSRNTFRFSWSPLWQASWQLFSMLTRNAWVPVLFFWFSCWQCSKWSFSSLWEFFPFKILKPVSSFFPSNVLLYIISYEEESVRGGIALKDFKNNYLNTSQLEISKTDRLNKFLQTGIVKRNLHYCSPLTLALL